LLNILAISCQTLGFGDAGFFAWGSTLINITLGHGKRCAGQRCWLEAGWSAWLTASYAESRVRHQVDA
tara:strand:- start:977 stop:1180 length:204 start_codon:yes stop_codon:yes gene_type:complete